MITGAASVSGKILARSREQQNSVDLRHCPGGTIVLAASAIHSARRGGLPAMPSSSASEV